MKLSVALPAPVAAVFPGALVCVVVALAAMSLSEHYGGPQLLYALLLGLALHFLMGHAAVRPGIDFCGRVALRAGVALLGARITLGQIGSLGVASGVTVVVALALTIGLGLCLARWLRRPMEEGLLSGGAVAICGASAALAIASVMPRTRENERFTLLVVVGVTVLSTLAMMVYPSVLYMVRVPPLPSGIFLGGTIHDVGQVVAAGMMLGPDVGDVATVVKLLRVALLMPVVFLVALFFGRGAPGRGPRWALIPGFLVAFVVMVLLRSAGLVPAPVVDVASALSRGLLVVAIAATGIKTSFEDLLRLGWMPVVMLLAETFFIAAFMLAAIVLLGLPR